MDSKEKQARTINWSIRFTEDEFAWIDKQRRLLPDPTVAAYIRELIRKDREQASEPNGKIVACDTNNETRDESR